MRIWGYIFSSVFTNFIQFYCMEKLLHRKRIATPIILLVPFILGVLTTLQTEFFYQTDLNSVVSVIAIFLLTCCYRESWVYRFFVSLLLFILALVAEGSGWLIARLFITVEDMNHANENAYFALVGFLGFALHLLYAAAMLKIVKLFKKRNPKATSFILFLIMVLVYGLIDLLVTFADTAYLIPALILSVLLIAAIAGCLYLFNDQLRVQRERLLLAHLEEMQQDQLKHYTALYEANRQVAVQRHDLKNILLNIRSYVQLGEYDKLDRFVAGFQQQLQPAALIDNGMPFIDAVLSAKMAEHTDIPFTLRVSPLTLEHLDQSCIAFILAGALDNAVEACMQSAKPFIRVSLGQKDRMISLVVENAADAPVKAVGDTLLTTKTDAASHGYGVKSMQQTAEQAHGALTWRHENGEFTLSVLFQDL